MQKTRSHIVFTEDLSTADHALVGQKAKNLARLQQHHIPIPSGFCLSAGAYRQFIQTHGLDDLINAELQRKPIHQLRWEEMWDAAHRIRHAFLCHIIPTEIKAQLIAALKHADCAYPLAVRSSSTQEDSARFSFAGLHTSVLNVQNEQELLDSIATVWASLWSDAVLLYQHVLEQDPKQSQMAVLIQSMVPGLLSGVTFTADPNQPDRSETHLEVVPGSCQHLVKGDRSPQRYVVLGSSVRLDSDNNTPRLLSDEEVVKIHLACRKIEAVFKCPMDIEWTLDNKCLTILQARPITARYQGNDDDNRDYFLSLKPNIHRLKLLNEHIHQQLVPKLKAAGDNMAAEPLGSLDDKTLAAVITKRYNLLQEWRVNYRNYFVPFGHGIRQLGAFYNEVVKPRDPYEFVHCLAGEQRIASTRNAELKQLIELVQSKSLIDTLEQIAASDMTWETLDTLANQQTAELIHQLCRFRQQYLETTYLSDNLDMAPQLLINIILNYLQQPADRNTHGQTATHYTEKLLNAVPKHQVALAKDILSLAKASWRLRDDDNMLLGRINNHVLKGLAEGVRRLLEQGRLQHQPTIAEPIIYELVNALRDPSMRCTELGKHAEPQHQQPATGRYQLNGQPACHGQATGPARCIHKLSDLSQVQPGDILICDGVDPSMTLVMPLCAGIVEMRGGMLIHGVIVARELGIPCVTGVLDALHIAKNGDTITLDGNRGVVVIQRS